MILRRPRLQFSSLGFKHTARLLPLERFARSMRIVYDNIIFSLQKAGGISVYWSELINRVAATNESVTFYGGENGNLFGKELKVQTRKESGMPAQILRYLPFTKKLPNGTLFHSSYYRVSLQRSVKNIVTVHDFTYEHFAHGPRKYVHAIQKRFAIRNADGIICVSENTKKDLLTFYPDINVPVIVIHHSGSEAFCALSKDREKLNFQFPELHDTKFILFVGDRSEYKNFPCAINAVSKMEGYHLVFVGGGTLSKNHTQLLDAELPGRYSHFLGIGEFELNILYNHAFCLLYPSSYEGFGLPVLEAMQAGCPVVALRTSSIPEVAGDSALLSETAKTTDLVENMSVLEDSYFRNELVKKGIKRAENFSWDACFQKTYAFYKAVDAQS